MGGIYPRYRIIVGILFVLIHHSIHNVTPPSSWIIDNRHITQSWPHATLAWIGRHAPPARVQHALDALLEHEKITSILTHIYSHYYLSPDDRELLAQEGFTFLGGKLNIFEVVDIPGYVFKMAAPRNGHSELLNLGRIALADMLRERARTWRMKSFLTIPIKYAYIVPSFNNVAYSDQPKVIIIAEKVPNYRTKRKTRVMVAKAWLKLKKTPDLRKCNMYYSQTGLALIDTEPWRTASLVPGFTTIPAVIRRPGTRIHEDDERAYMPETSAMPPTQVHNFAGRWQCVTPQGLIVRSPYLRCITCWCSKERR